jgi:hypothetical protein
MPQVQVLSPRPAASRRGQVAHYRWCVAFSFIVRDYAASFLSVKHSVMPNPARELGFGVSFYARSDLLIERQIFLKP